MRAFLADLLGLLGLLVFLYQLFLFGWAVQ
jgi:hypothetical protein